MENTPLELAMSESIRNLLEIRQELIAKNCNQDTEIKRLVQENKLNEKVN